MDWTTTLGFVLLAVGALALLAAPYQELLMLWDVPIEYELAQEAS